MIHPISGNAFVDGFIAYAIIAVFLGLGNLLFGRLVRRLFPNMKEFRQRSIAVLFFLFSFLFLIELMSILPL
jgi:hypothetical protein